jgi:hypothetical protein
MVDLQMADSFDSNTYRTPIDDGLSGQAKNLIAGRYRDKPAFHDIFDTTQEEKLVE